MMTASGTIPRMTAFDPRRLVWIEHDKQLELRAFLSGTPPRPTETVKVSYPSPQRVELEANLESAGNRRPLGHSLSRLETDDRRPARTDLQGQPRDARRRGSGGLLTAWFTPTNHARSRSAEPSALPAWPRPRSLPSAVPSGRAPHGPYRVCGVRHNKLTTPWPSWVSGGRAGPSSFPPRSGFVQDPLSSVLDGRAVGKSRL